MMLHLQYPPMHTYLISDLHLTPERPHITAAFLHFLKTEAISAERLYILGDLFEFWIGDDAAERLGATPILDAMKQLSESVDCAFIAGNRDFLVRERFSQCSGFTILADETVVDLYGTPTLLLHGDSLCTDDHAHQAFRSNMVNNTEFCQHFLAASIEERLEQAKQARQQSNEHKTEISMGIMDVTEQAVINAFEKHQVQQMIHGHTHRQNTHWHQSAIMGQCQRYVLGDWHTTSSIMKISHAGIKIDNQTIQS